MANILLTAWRFRDLLATRQASVERELVNAYAAVWDRLEDDATALAGRIASAIEDGTEISPSWLLQQERYRILQAQTAAEIERISRGLGPTLTQLQAEAVVLGDAAARAMLAEQGVTALVRLPNDQLIDLVGRLSNGSPLRAVLDELGPDASLRIQNALLTGIGTGQGTDAIARQMRDALGGNMARARHMARTESVGSYRRAAQRNAMQHADIMEGWRWSASLMNFDPPPCPVCLSMHGQTFPLDTPFESHISCRCVPVFITRGSRVDFGPSGEEWFADQSKDYQRSVLRKGEMAAYQAGDLELTDLVKYEVDPEWGGSRTRKPMIEIFPPKQAQSYWQEAAD